MNVFHLICGSYGIEVWRQTKYCLFKKKLCMLKKTLNANSEKPSELVCFRKRPANLFTQESVSDLSKLSQVSVGGRENTLIEVS